MVVERFSPMLVAVEVARPRPGRPAAPCCCLLLRTPGEAARQLWSKLCDHFWVLKAALRPVRESCWKLAVSGVEQVVEQEVEQEVVGCVALLGLLEPVELQLSLPCRQACSARQISFCQHNCHLSVIDNITNILQRSAPTQHV